MNLPNKLTVARIILTFFFMFVMFLKPLMYRYIALLIFTIATLTDYFDGKLARQYNLITTFGKIMDPVADKILVLGAFLIFVELSIIPFWMFFVILVREVLVSGLRIVASAKGVILPAKRHGKHKTISQFVAIFVILIYFAFKETLICYTKIWNVNLEQMCNSIIYIVMLATLFFTIFSGVYYLWKNKELLIK